MRPYLFVLILLSLVSCAHRNQKPDLEAKIQAQEARSLEELRSDLGLILSEHPEIDAGTKKSLTTRLEEFIRYHSELKDRESRIIGLKIQRSLSARPAENDALRSELQDVYAQKATNVFTFVKDIKRLTQPAAPKESFYEKFQWFMREVR